MFADFCAAVGYRDRPQYPMAVVVTRAASRNARAAQHLGERDRAAAERPVCGVEQRVPCPSVQGIPFVEVGDQHTRVDDDHEGQSSRSRLSSPGSSALVSAPLVRRIAARRRAVSSSRSRSMTSRPSSTSRSSSSSRERTSGSERPQLMPSLLGKGQRFGCARRLRPDGGTLNF